jgi:hypothetical protein
MESVLKSFSVEKASSFQKEILEFIFQFVRLSKYILIFREHGKNIILAHYSIYMLVQVFLGEVKEICVLGIQEEHPGLPRRYELYVILRDSLAPGRV